MRKLGLIGFCILCVQMLLFGQGYQPWEEFKKDGPDLKQIGTLATRHSSEIESSPWSVGCETLDRDYADFSVYQDYVGALGVKHARLQSGWAKCEKEKGVYDFTWLDSCVYGLANQGVNPWLSLSYGNPLYASEKGLGSKIFTDEPTMKAWLNYVEATVERYQDVVREWEVWNEPKHSESHEAYANLMMKTIEVIKKVQPEAIILGFTVHGFTPGIVLKFPKRIFEILQENGKEDIVDYVTYHPYTYNPDECYDMVDGLKALATSFDPDIKLYQGESGAPSEYRETMALSKYEWTEISQAKWVLRRMLGDYIRDIRSSVFTIVDLKYPHEINRKGIIHINEDKTIDHPKYAYYGVRNVAGLLDNTFESMGLLEYKTNSSRTLTVAELVKEEQPSVLLWFDDEIPDNQLDRTLVDLEIEGVEISNPVYVDLMTGNIYNMKQKHVQSKNGKTYLKNLPLWDSPILLIDKSQVEIIK